MVVEEVVVGGVFEVDLFYFFASFSLSLSLKNLQLLSLICIYLTCFSFNSFLSFFLSFFSSFLC